MAGPGGDAQELTAVIDTGYNGFLTLPVAIAEALSLEKGAAREVTLGDASRKVFDYYNADADWNGQRRKVRVLCVEGVPLVGTALLAGYAIGAEFAVGGAVVLRPIS